MRTPEQRNKRDELKTYSRHTSGVCVLCVCYACVTHVLCVCCACVVRVLCVCCACVVRVLCGVMRV